MLLSVVKSFARIIDRVKVLFSLLAKNGPDGWSIGQPLNDLNTCTFHAYFG
ncbi:hypothetical protein Hanom_Chr07g00615001 [Helianthus anomalus]